MVAFLYARRWKRKKQNQILLNNAFDVYNLRVLEHFVTQKLDIVQNLYEYFIILTQKLCVKTWYSLKSFLPYFRRWHLFMRFKSVFCFKGIKAIQIIKAAVMFRQHSS